MFIFMRRLGFSAASTWISVFSLWRPLDGRNVTLTRTVEPKLSSNVLTLIHHTTWCQKPEDHWS